MVTYVLDASAILRFLDGEAGSVRVGEIIKGHLAAQNRIVMAAINWGEVAGVTYKAHGQAGVDLALSRLSAFGFEITPATEDRAVRAALLKVKLKIAYADAFAVELALDSTDHILVTADFDLKAAAQQVKIEFLPRK